jgi:hypothetical protein
MMTILAVFPTTVFRNARPNILSAAIVVFCAIAFPGASAWGQGLFIYRDLNPGISSNEEQSLSLRFMRHIWIVQGDDSVMAAVAQKGGYDGHGLTLYKTLNEGGNWTLEADLSNEGDIICDGILDPDNNLLLVTSLIGESRTADVTFIKLTYEPTLRTWTVDPLTPVTVFASTTPSRGTRATISMDSNGVLWCAFRHRFDYLGIPGFVQIKLSYSADGGYTWVDTGKRFGAFNRLAQKSAKVLAAGSRTALVYQDLQGVPLNMTRYKSWAYREDNQPLLDDWTTGTISQMVVATDDTLGSHWSIAADTSGNLHMSYQDAGIRYLKYDAALGAWLDPFAVATNDGIYNSISVAANNDVYLFTRFSVSPKVYCKRYAAVNKSWSRWLAMSAAPRLGYLRMSSPENFADHLPLLYETKVNSPYELLYILFDASALTICRQAP